MRLLIDIMHIPHINFLKNAVWQWQKDGHEIIIMCLDRGKNVSIVKEEFKGIKIIPIGHHRGTFWSIIFQANFIRFFLIMNHLLKNKYDCGISVGSFLMGFSLKIFGIPNLQFYDDPENKKNLFFQKLTATQLFYPDFFESQGILNFKGLKEWAYLSPYYFKPNINVLTKYNLKRKEFIFIREVNSNTTNYMGQSSDVILSIAKDIDSNFKVLLSLENKEKRSFYPENWIILEEPVQDIHSLMYYSGLVVSSGDSMAREGALLGVPSIYCGIRSMLANKKMEGTGFLYHIDIKIVTDFVHRIMRKEIILKDQMEFRNELAREWDDITEFILNKVEKYNLK